MGNKYGNKYQCVYITTSDGETHTFMGRAVFDSKCEGKLKIVDIKFSIPTKLPSGHYFEEINNGK